MTDHKLTAGQIAAIETLARDLLIIEPQDRLPAILMMDDGYRKKLRAEFPDLPETTIESAVTRFCNLIMRRFTELNLLAQKDTREH
jgi:hypothetical protein